MSEHGTSYPAPAHRPGSDDPGRDLNWLLANFVERTPGVDEAVAVSSDGFLLATSNPVVDDGIEQFAAIISGLNSLTKGAAALYDYQHVRQVIVEMDLGYLFVMAVDSGSTVGVLADERSDVGSVGYEMTLMIDRIGSLLTPLLIEELKNAISLRTRPS